MYKSYQTVAGAPQIDNFDTFAKLIVEGSSTKICGDIIYVRRKSSYFHGLQLT